MLSACQSTKVSIDYDTETTFKNFKSFNFIADKKTTDEIKTDLDNPILMARIRAAIKEQLIFQGFTYQAEGADLIVDYHFTQQEKENNSSFSRSKYQT